MQASLFDLATPTFDPTFRGVRRLDIGAGAWVEYAPRFLAGHAQVFRELRDGVRWRTASRPMYDRIVDVPRLLAGFPDDGPLPAVLGQFAHVLSRRYDRDLTRVAAACYRDGQDSVAPHGDRLHDRTDSVIAILSLGEPRRFLLRPTDPSSGSGHDFALGWGDLLVMGGTCQDTWRHGVPKCAFAGPRISVQYRESRPDWATDRAGVGPRGVL